MRPATGVYIMVLVLAIVVATSPSPQTALPKETAETLATNAIRLFSKTIDDADAAPDSKRSAIIELRSVAKLSESIGKLQKMAEADPSLVNMAVMQGIIGLQSALVNYAIYDITGDEDILRSGRASAENALRLLTASIQLAREGSKGSPQESRLPPGEEKL